MSRLSSGMRVLASIHDEVAQAGPRLLLPKPQIGLDKEVALPRASRVALDHEPVTGHLRGRHVGESDDLARWRNHKQLKQDRPP